MKVQIKQFKNLHRISFEAPCSIYGQNGKGKSNCIGAILWTISEKNTENEEVIPFGEHYAEVSILVDGITFTRRTEFKITRKAGETTEKVNGTISTYSVSGEVMNKGSYFIRVKEFLGGTQYAEPFHFFGQKTAEKLEIINQIVGLPKPTVNLSELQRAVKSAKTDIDNQLFLIENLNSKSADQNELQQIIDKKDAEILELKKQIIDKNPEIEAFNDSILEQIKEVENSSYQPLTKKSIRDISEIEKQLIELQPLKVETPELIRKEKPEPQKMPTEPVKPTEITLPEKAAECSKCELFKKAVKESKGNFDEKLAEYEIKMRSWLQDCELIEKLNNQNSQNWKDANKEAETAFEIAQENFEKAQEYNAKIPARRKELESLKDEIEADNANIIKENALIDAKNIENLTIFEAKKQEKILSLKSQLKAQDYSATNTQILQRISELENAKKVFTDELAVISNKISEKIAAGLKLNDLRNVLILVEKKLIEAKTEWQNWRNSFDKKCLVFFDGKVKINTTRETYSDTIEDCFEVYFNRSGEWVEFEYLNHSDQILCAVEVAKVLCEKTACRIPLLIDNAEAINENRHPKNCLLAIVSETIEFQIK